MSIRKKAAVSGRGLTAVITTVADKKDAKRLANLMLDVRLAACVQVMPIQSFYCWRGQREEASEFILLAKTRAALAGRLMQFIARHHAYETPEIIALPIAKSAPAYLQWVRRETAPR